MRREAHTKARMSTARSFFASLIFTLFSFFLVGAFSPVSAQSSLPQAQLGVDVPQNQHTLVQTLTSDVLSSLTCFVIGIDPNTPTHQCLVYDKTTNTYTYAPDTNLGLAGSLLSALPIVFELPVHTVDYTRYVAGNFGISRPTYAAPGDTGTGNQQLAPLLPFWIAMRNLVYLLYVVAFVVIGAGIMLRLKMDPRTVMTIQNQIPRIIVSILLVTFSYAISGILIDAMYVTIYTVYSVANRIDVGDPGAKEGIRKTQDDIFGNNPLDFVNNMFSIIGISYSTGSEATRVITNLMLPRNWGLGETDTAGGIPVVSGFVGIVKSIGSFIVGDVINIFKVLLTAVAGVVGIVILPLIIGLAIIVSLIRLWFTLIRAYVIIIVNIIIAPFWIFLGIFPGSKVNFEAWFRQQIAYLLVFPATILLFIFAKLISVSFAQHSGSVYFAPPLIGTFAGLETLSNLVAFGVILIGPILLDQIIIVMKAPTAGAISKAVTGGFMEGRKYYDNLLYKPAKSVAFSKNIPGRAFGAGPEFSTRKIERVNPVTGLTEVVDERIATVEGGGRSAARQFEVGLAPLPATTPPPAVANRRERAALRAGQIASRLLGRRASRWAHSAYKQAAQKTGVS